MEGMTLFEQKSKWKEELTESISSVLEGIGNLLNKSSNNFDEYIQLSARNRQNVKNGNSGIVDLDSIRIEENKIRKSVIELINTINEKDLTEVKIKNSNTKPNLDKIKEWLESKLSTIFFKVNYIDREENGLVRKWNVEYSNYRIAHDKTDLILVYVQRIGVTRNGSKARVNKIILDNRVVIPLEKLSIIKSDKKRSKDYFPSDKQSKEYINYIEFGTLYEQKAIKVEEYKFSEIFEENKLIETDNKKTDKYLNNFLLIMPEEPISLRLEKAFTELKNRIVSDEIF